MAFQVAIEAAIDPNGDLDEARDGSPGCCRRGVHQVESRPTSSASRNGGLVAGARGERSDTYVD